MKKIANKNIKKFINKNMKKIANKNVKKFAKNVYFCKKIVYNIRRSVKTKEKYGKGLTIDENFNVNMGISTKNCRWNS